MAKITGRTNLRFRPGLPNSKALVIKIGVKLCP